MSLQLARPLEPAWRLLLGWLTGRDAYGRPRLHVAYDRDADLLFARFGAPAEADTVVVDDDVAVRLSRTTGQPIGIEVTDCAHKFHKDPSAITAEFARELLARYGQEARAVLTERLGANLQALNETLQEAQVTARAHSEQELAERIGSAIEQLRARTSAPERRRRA